MHNILQLLKAAGSQLASASDLFNLQSLQAIHDLADVLPTIDNYTLHWLHFEHPQIALSGALLAVIVIVLLRYSKQPTVGHSRLPKLRSKPRYRLLRAVRSTSMFVLLISLPLAIAMPTKVEPLPGSKVQTVDVLLILDNSSNVKEYITSSRTVLESARQALNPPEGTCGEITNWGERKLDAEAWAACQIAEALPYARLTVGTFDGEPHCCAPPLVLDHKFVNRSIRNSNQTIGDNSSNFDGPNANRGEGPGIIKVVLDFLERESDCKSKIVVFMTDGDGTIDPAQFEILAKRFAASYAANRLQAFFMLGPGADTVAYDGPDVDPVRFARDPRVRGTIADLSKPEELNSVIEAMKKVPTAETKVDGRIQERPVYDAFLLLALIAALSHCAASAALGRIR